MLISSQIYLVGTQLYTFIETIDYDGFLKAGGTPEQWESCINVLYDGFPEYTGEGSYTQYLDDQADFLDQKYRAYDLAKSGGSR